MFQIERHKKLIDYINNKKKASISELSEVLGVSLVTIRKDLDELSAEGLVIKTRGVAVSVYSSFSKELPYNKKYLMNTDEKKRIGAAAAELVEDGDVIILDSGSTTLEIAKRIMKKNITVITNDLKVASQLVASPTVNLIVVGGIVEKLVYTMMGTETEAFLSKIHVNKSFLGADALDVDYGISNRTLNEVNVKSAMLRAAEQTIVVTDHTKLNKKVFAFLCTMDEIDTLVIDDMDEISQKHLEDKGVKVIIANKTIGGNER